MDADALSTSERLRPVNRQRRFGSARSILALILREMSSTYGRSPGGYLWAILEPAAGIALLSVIFSLGFRHPPLGTNFPIFYASGMLPFLMFTTVSAKVSQAMLFSKQLLVYPSVTFLDAILARFILAALTQLLIGYILFTGILLAFETRTQLDFPHIIQSYAMAAALALGIGTLNCHLFLMFPLWQNIWSVLTRPLIFVSGVIILIDRFPEPYKTYVTFNPLVHVTAEMRVAFYSSYHPDYIDPVYVYLVALISFTVGLIFLRRYQRVLLNL